MFSIFIEPHERHEAVEAYRDKLTQAQIGEISDAPETAIINLRFGVGSAGTKIVVLEEG